MKKIGLILWALLGFAEMTTSAAVSTNQKVIGATVGDFADLVKDQLKPALEKRGYKIKLIEFTDYVQPNIALAEGGLDLNIFQHKPYLEQFSKERNLALATVSQVPTAPLGLYPGRKKTLTEITEGSKVAVPNDPTNLARALVLLAKNGWIELPKDIDAFHVTPRQIVKNLKKIEIVQLEAAQIPRTLRDVDFAVINGNYVVSSGLQLSSALTFERSDAYVNWAVARATDAQSPFVRDVREILNSAEFRSYAKLRFKGYKFPTAWKE